MKIIHTADLHLGRQFNGIPLEEDHAAVLDQIFDAVLAHRADVLIIAGDIYDRAIPPTSAVRQFNAFLAQIASKTEAAVVMIAGNHDSGDRIGSMSIWSDNKRALIRGPICADEAPFIMSDVYGPVAFSALPFAYEYAARECFSDETIHTPEDVLAAQLAAARVHIPDGARWVVVAHAFVTGALGSEGERSLTRVGGIETISSEIFKGAHYVALGHLHRPQEVGPTHIRYSGSPLAFGFDEAEEQKSMTLLTIDAAGVVKVEVIPFSPVRDVRVLRGKHAELLLAPPSSDFIKAVLTDDAPVIDGMKRLRAVFPHCCDLTYERDTRAPQIKSLDGRPIRIASPIDVMADFLQLVRDEGLSAEERIIVTAAIGRIGAKEDAV